MKFLATTSLALVTLVALTALPARPSHADPFAHHARLSSGISTSSIIVPADWAGTWQNCDTVYTCAGAFQSASCDTDTLCAGQVFDTDPSVTCTGSFTSTSFTEHCTATGQVFPDCQYTINIDAHGTRTADSFFLVATTTTTYSGTGTGCNLLPPQCTQINSHGTRLGPAPPVYCASPTRPASWGQMKVLYR